MVEVYTMRAGVTVSEPLQMQYLIHPGKLPYLRELTMIRYTFKKHYPSFPHLCCMDASKVVAETLGLEEIAGTYYGKVELEIGSWQKREESYHAWNYDPLLGIYIDLTQDQFEPRLPGLVILPKQNPFLVEDVNKTNELRGMCIPDIKPVLREVKKAIQHKDF